MSGARPKVEGLAIARLRGRSRWPQRLLPSGIASCAHAVLAALWCCLHHARAALAAGDVVWARRLAMR
eukprot:14590297-Alexandrium_andersonii.AAC.1